MTTVVGGDRFHVVARRLRGAANRKEMVKELRTALQRAAPALKAGVREDAAEYLPDAYAAELVPTLRFRTGTTVSGDSVRMTVTVTAAGKGGSGRAVGDLEDGDLRHPVFGRSRALKRHAVHRATSRMNPWVNQRVKPGFVTEPMNRRRPAVRKEIEAAVDRVLTKVAGG